MLFHGDFDGIQVGSERAFTTLSIIFEGCLGILSFILIFLNHATLS